MRRLPRVARPFLLPVTAAFLLVAVMASVLVFRLQGLARVSTSVEEGLRETLSINEDLRHFTGEQIALVQGAIATPDPDLRRRFLELHLALGGEENRFMVLPMGDGERLQVERVKRLRTEMEIVALAVFEATQEGELGGVAELMARIHALEVEMANVFDSLAKRQIEVLSTALAQSQAGITALYLLVAWIGISFLALLALMVGLFRARITGPVQGMLRAARAMGDGDFQVQVPVIVEDELGQLAEQFNRLAHSLADTYQRLEDNLAERTGNLEAVRHQLVHAERLAAMGQLVGGVAHELNNPLTSILGFAELAQQDHNCSAETRRRLGLVIGEAERCAHIVESLLHFARRSENHRDTFSLLDAVQSVIDLRQYDLENRKIILSLEHDGSAPAVSGDLTRLQQVLLNLLGNAMDAVNGRPGGRRIRVLVGSDGGLARMEVHDNGAGFVDVHRAFEPFYTTKEIGKGTGLGLSVCLGIVEEHGGSIAIDNWGGGARVQVILPLIERVPEPAARPAKVPEPAAAAGSRPARVLVVEDEKPLLDLQLELLAQMGLAGAGVSSGQAAMEHLQQTTVDLIIADIRMPGSTNGLDLFDWVRLNKPDLARRFLLSTGDAAGANGTPLTLPAPCLRKPFTATEYRQTVRRFLAEA